MKVSSFSIEDGARTVVTVDGELDIASVWPLRSTLDELIARGQCRIALVLSDVSFMDSSALGVVLSRRKQAVSAGGRLDLVAPNERIRRVLSITGLDGIFTIYDSLPELVAADQQRAE